MKAQIKIPAGYRRLRIREITQDGDLYLRMLRHYCPKTLEWEGVDPGIRIEEPEIVIRKIKNPKRSKK